MVDRVWFNQPYNFDHLGMAMVSLFVTATLNGYTGAVAWQAACSNLCWPVALLSLDIM
jgi:hypothetical protein